ncbi:pimeloyl-ACP methyl ester carboxylesterase [Bradyrhizobium sp. JR7.2]|jgi:pimeloyl-ACP methyl ester carboxylesterase|uniref:Alpha/beta hydrolase n=1 Tax=Bradyrhizobium barranii TaxID=2992140 RepID=A0ABY3QQ90_9BRAD|nr:MULTISPECIES: alpha/beta hydrolase [Bradyrhizobium]UFW87935.1 alpha/beta hydrolase [Bradyrhizobium japonicum]WFT96482.1 alpha/beta hydrolase [Bradyrhizobium barranii]CUU15128.1 Probable signal peptide protein CDS [Bradyrhizobium sp.]
MNQESPKPTVVLVHGAFEDASIWNGVIERLQRDGYPVVAFGNPLLGPAIDTAYLRSLLDKIQGPVILAAHSYGGAVITQAGDDPKVKGLVYAASIMPAVGEAATHLLERYPGSTFPTSVEPTTYTLPDGTSGTYLLYQPDKFHSNVAADVPASVAALMLAGQRPMNLAALTEPLTSAAWTSKPSWQVRPLQDRAIPVDEYKFEADRAHSTVIEVNASHAVPVSNPEVVADAIEQAARAAAK